MTTDALHTDELKKVFSQKDAFNVQDIGSFYQSLEPADVPQSTVNWRIYKLVERGIIQRVGRGKYQIGVSSFFEPGITGKMIQVNRYMKKQFPYIKYIVWHIGDINTFSQHLFNKDITFVEVERDVVESVTDQLRDKFKYVQDSRAASSLYPNESVIMVRPLVSGAPVQTIQTVPTTTLEKILVDIYSDKVFDFFQGNELSLIFKNAFSSYTIHQERLLRYASRKEKRAVISEFIQTIK
jgi:hypothetical protein